MQVFYIVQQLDHVVYVMSVHRTEVTDTETLKQVVLLCKQCLQAIIEADDIPPAVVVYQLHLFQAAIHVVTHFVVCLAGCDIYQILA